MRIHNRAGWSVNIEHPLLPQLAPVSLSLHVSYGPPRCTIDGLAATVQQAQRYYDQGRTMSSVMNMRYTDHFLRLRSDHQRHGDHRRRGAGDQ